MSDDNSISWKVSSWERAVCLCSTEGFTIHLNVFLCSVSSALCVPSGKCSVYVHCTHFWCTVWKVFLCLCAVHISDVPSGKCSVSVHSTHFWCPNLWYLCSRFLVQVLCCSHRFVLLAPFCVARTVLCCSHRFVLLAPFCVARTVLFCSHHFVLLATFCVARTVLCCSHRFTVILPWYRQFQSLSNL